MKEIVRLPQWGDEMNDGEVGECYVQCGDHVDKGDALVTIEIDKTSVEIESPVSGRVLSIETEVGKIVPVGSVLAEIEIE